MTEEPFSSIQFSKSRVKILRAGPANSLLFGILVGSIFLYLVMQDYNFTLPIIILCELSMFLILLFLYSRALSRITLSGRNIIFECSLHEVAIPKKNIKRSYTILLRINIQIIFIVFEKNKILPHIFTAIKMPFDMSWMIPAKEEFQKFVREPDDTGENSGNSKDK